MKHPGGVGWFEGYFTLAPRHIPWYAALTGTVFLAVAVMVPPVRTSVLIQLAVPPPAPGLAPGRYMALSISDTGRGMDEETRSRIFEPCFGTRDDRCREIFGVPLSRACGSVSVSSFPRPDPGWREDLRVARESG